MKMRIVELIKQDSWVAAFDIEAKLLLESLGDQIVGLHHIGSTSIPGIYAKPIIDMIMEVDDIHMLDAVESKFRKLGYEAKGEHGISGRRFYAKGGARRSHHIHAFNRGSDEVLRHLAFRDYLIAHPGRARDYEQLKLRLGEQFRESPAAYSAGKGPFIQKIECAALIWYAAKNHITREK